MRSARLLRIMLPLLVVVLSGCSKEDRLREYLPKELRNAVLLKSELQWFDCAISVYGITGDDFRAFARNPPSDWRRGEILDDAVFDEGLNVDVWSALYDSDHCWSPDVVRIVGAATVEQFLSSKDALYYQDGQAAVFVPAIGKFAVVFGS